MADLEELGEELLDVAPAVEVCVGGVDDRGELVGVEVEELVIAEA